MTDKQLESIYSEVAEAMCPIGGSVLETIDAIRGAGVTWHWEEKKYGGLTLIVQNKLESENDKLKRELALYRTASSYPREDV